MVAARGMADREEDVSCFTRWVYVLALAVMGLWDIAGFGNRVVEGSRE